MSFSPETYAVARKYTDDSMQGAGAVAGKPCQIQSIVDITGGKRVTFLWIDNSSVEHTSTMDVMNGLNGQDGQDGEDGQDGKGIQSVSVNALNHLILTYTDGTVVDAGEIEISSAVNSVCGKTGNVTLDAEDVGALPDDTVLPTKVSDLLNDEGFIDNTVNNLLNYYLKTETYTKAEVDALVNTISSLTLDIVSELPTSDISTTTIYLIETSAGSNIYMQYAYINSAWAQLGTTQIDLTGYYNKTQTDALLADKQDVLTFDNVPTSGSVNPVKSAGILSAINDALATKQDVLTFDNAPTEDSTNPVKSGGVYSALEAKQDALLFDVIPTENSDNPVTSGGVFEALQNVQSNLEFDEDDFAVEDESVALAAKQRIFTGTKAQWNALSTATKTLYGQVNLTDDYDEYGSVVKTYVSNQINVGSNTAMTFTFGETIPKGKYLMHFNLTCSSTTDGVMNYTDEVLGTLSIHFAKTTSAISTLSADMACAITISSPTNTIQIGYSWASATTSAKLFLTRIG